MPETVAGGEVAVVGRQIRRKLRASNQIGRRAFRVNQFLNDAELVFLP